MFPSKIVLKKHHGEGVLEGTVRWGGGGVFYNPLTQRLLVACYYFDPATVSWRVVTNQSAPHSGAGKGGKENAV